MIKGALIGCVLAGLLFAAPTDEQAIRSVMDAQVASWNRGDIDSFGQGYLDSPDILFIGKEIARGHQQMIARYHKAYPTREKMGKLQFTDLEIRTLGSGYANVVGRFHLVRSDAGGGKADGIFTLLFQKTPRGWKIIQDHTT